MITRYTIAAVRYAPLQVADDLLTVFDHPPTRTGRFPFYTAHHIVETFAHVGFAYDLLYYVSVPFQYSFLFYICRCLLFFGLVFFENDESNLPNTLPTLRDVLPLSFGKVGKALQTAMRCAIQTPCMADNLASLAFSDCETRTVVRVRVRRVVVRIRVSDPAIRVRSVVRTSNHTVLPSSASALLYHPIALNALNALTLAASTRDPLKARREP